MAFQGFQGDEDESRDLAEINIVPLVDVMLVLLIIFMVTAPLSIGGITIKLPQGTAKLIDIKEERIVLTINSKGQYFISDAKVAPLNLMERFKAIYDGREQKDLYIRADKAVAYGSVISAMSAAKEAGVIKISMLTETKNNAH